MILKFQISEIKKIGFIFQNFNLLEDFTVIENIMLPGRLTKIDETELKEKH